MPVAASARFTVAFAVGVLLLLLPARVTAQIPEPPTTFYGSVTDAAGPVAAGVPIVAIVNNNICGETATFHVGEATGLVTMYVIDVISNRQTAGCGKPGDAVRLKVGDRLAERAVPWAGTGELVQFNIVFGGATPAAIPTATRTPTPPPGTTATTVPRGTPGTEATASVGAASGASPVSTRQAVATTSTPAIGEAASSDGGLPVWALLLLVVGGIAAVGGGVGFALSRRGEHASAADHTDEL